MPRAGTSVGGRLRCHEGPRCPSHASYCASLEISDDLLKLANRGWRLLEREGKGKTSRPREWQADDVNRVVYGLPAETIGDSLARSRFDPKLLKNVMEQNHTGNVELNRLRVPEVGLFVMVGGENEYRRVDHNAGWEQEVTFT